MSESSARPAHRVYATDLVDYGCPDSESGVDFLMERASFDGPVVANPPFKVAHALTLCPRVIMLLRLPFLESRRRPELIDGSSRARVHVFQSPFS